MHLFGGVNQGGAGEEMDNGRGEGSEPGNSLFYSLFIGNLNFSS